MDCWSWAARFRCRTCESSTTPRRWNDSISTWNLRPATTDRAPWLERPEQALLCMPAVKMHPACGASSMKTKSRRESFPYEHLSNTGRRAPNPRVHGRRSAFSVSRRHAFRILRGPPVPGLCRHLLGQTNHALLEQTSGRPARTYLSFGQGRHRIPSVLAEGLPPDWQRESPQSPRARTRIHPRPHRNARLRARESRSRLPRNGARQGCLLLYGTSVAQTASALENLWRTSHGHADRPLFCRPLSHVPSSAFLRIPDRHPHLHPGHGGELDRIRASPAYVSAAVSRAFRVPVSLSRTD